MKNPLIKFSVVPLFLASGFFLIHGCEKENVLFVIIGSIFTMFLSFWFIFFGFSLENNK
jgi:hypothetical protein